MKKTVYIENSKESTKTPIRLIGEFSKFTGYKTSTKKLIVFPERNN